MKRHLLFAAAIAACIFLGGGISPVRAADLDQPFILVARPGLRDAVFGATVLVVTPVGGDVHVGFIVNRPSKLRLGTVIPEHAPAQKLSEMLYLGGPVETDFLFALVEGRSSPGGKSFEIMPGIYAAYEATVIDRIIKSESGRARFLAGLVAWHPGELRAEIDFGAWYVIEPDAGLVMSTPEGLWEKLVRRLQGLRT